jgi:gas vesicle protein
MSRQWGDIGKGMAIGGIIGAAAAVLFAPRSGKETREGIRRKAEELSLRTKEEYEKTLGKTKKAYEAVTSYFNHEKLTGEEWSYKNLQIKDGLKPGSEHFKYFYAVSEKGQKKCHYCVWITDEALFRFDESLNFDAIVSSQREVWNKWVKGKIDKHAFDSKVLKIETDGEKEIELLEIPEGFSM